MRHAARGGRWLRSADRPLPASVVSKIPLGDMTDVRSESGGTRRLVEELADRLCNWERWDRNDGLGALNLVTPEKRLEASAAVRSGEAFSLGFELRPDLPQPPNSGRLNPVHL